MQKNKKILDIENVSKEFEDKTSVIDTLLGKKKRSATVLKDIYLDVKENEILGLVGESGCGKSTLARCILQLHQVSGGNIWYNGEEITTRRKSWLRKNFCKDVQMIFQDPYSSLNPRMTVYDTLKEVLLYHKICTRQQVKERVFELMTMCGLDPSLADRYPGEFSGGQRQRIGIARALAVEPKIIIADEPVSALDVSIQAQIINLLADLKEKLNLTVIFISHDLRVVRYISDRVAVMYLGNIVELGDKEEIYEETIHPYTKMLLDSAPKVDPYATADCLDIDLGELPTPYERPQGCCFSTRCPYATEKCRTSPAKLIVQGGNNHMAACHYSKQLQGGTI